MKTAVDVTLTLSEEEAVWLRGVMRNPLHGETLADEGADQARLRQDLFRVLPVVFGEL